MVLLCVDDTLHLSHDTKPAMDVLRKLDELEPESCGPPTMYLGVNVVSKYQLEDGGMSWCMSACVTM